MARWTEQELADLAAHRDDWLAFSALHPTRSYESWEVKRRRIPGGSALEAPVHTRVKRGPELAVVPAAPLDYAGPLVGFWDLETTYSSQPRLLSGAVADGFGNVTVWHLRDSEERVEGRRCDACGGLHLIRWVGCFSERWTNDALIAQRIRDDLRKFHILVGWNSVLFDEPVLNGRLMIRMDDTLDPLTHKDLMYEFSGRKARVGRRSLANISTVFDSPHRKTELNPHIWDEADHGDEAMYDLIIEHNIADVLVTRDVFAYARPRIRKYIRGG